MWEYFFIQLFLIVVLTESVTELSVKSDIFKPVRNLLFKLGDWAKTLFSCGYCFSVWVAVGVVIATNTYYSLTDIHVVDLGLMALIIHRLSNYLHNFNDCWLDKYYNTRRVNSIKENDA